MGDIRPMFNLHTLDEHPVNAATNKEYPMTFLFIMALVSAIATLVVLVMGVMTMGRSGEANQARKNKLMRWRVGLQFLTLILLFLLGITYTSS